MKHSTKGDTLSEGHAFFRKREDTIFLFLSPPNSAHQKLALTPGALQRQDKKPLESAFVLPISRANPSRSC